MNKYLVTIESSYIDHIVVKAHDQTKARAEAKLKFLAKHPTLKGEDIEFSKRLLAEVL